MLVVVEKIILLLIKFFALLPLSVLYVFSDGLCFMLHHLARYRREVVRQNLKNSFPEKSREELRQIENGYYQHLADLFVEGIKLFHISDEELKQRIEVIGGDLIEKLSADGRSIVVFLGHYGNWEWVQEVTKYYRRPAISTEIYRHQHSRMASRLMTTMRSRFNTTPIEQKQALRTLLKMHQEGKQFLVGFIADQRPNSVNQNHFLTFLNQITAVPIGAEVIGTHIDAHFVYLEVSKIARGHYRMEFKEMTPADTTTQYPYTKLYMQLMEQTIRRKPEYWLWSHKRWSKWGKVNISPDNMI